MGLCGNLASLYEDYVVEGEGKQKTLPTNMSDMIADDGNLSKVIMKKNESSEMDYDIEDSHQPIQKGQNVQRIAPGTHDVLSKNQKGDINTIAGIKESLKSLNSINEYTVSNKTIRGGEIKAAQMQSRDWDSPLHPKHKKYIKHNIQTARNIEKSAPYKKG